MLLLLPLVLACSQAPDPDAGRALPPFVLGAHPEALLALELPQSSRPEGQATPTTSPLAGPWELAWEKGPIREYRADIPADQVHLGESERTAPAGMSLVDASGRRLPYERNRKKALRPGGITWRVTGRSILVRCAGDPPEGLVLRHPQAAAWEDGLNLGSAEVEPTAFALRRTDVVHDDQEGLLLPAPGLARWRVEVPRMGVLGFQARLLRPGVFTGARSDGAELVVRVIDGDRRREVDRVAVEPGAAWEHHSVSLAAWAGRTVELEIASEPDGDPLLDYVFLGQPAVYTPSERPRRLVLIFVDTLRRDHMGLYGYTRQPTTPVLDAWSQGAVVFDRARAAAPWTLPSSQALLSGRLPHRWDQGETIAERIGGAGWATGFLCANPYLRPSFGLDRGWSSYRYQLHADAGEQVDRALSFLEAWPDRDAAVLVQLMDPHLPYSEPEAYRELFAQQRPPGIKAKPAREDLMALDPEGPRFEEIRTWLLDRYDQNIRYADEELGRLLGALPEDAVVVFFADHGEEFWDHGGVEHGHAVWEELLAVPMMLRAPGLEPGRVQAPVSLLDVGPTLLELLGLPWEGQATDGRSLLPALRGEDGAIEALEERPLAFGQTLYGNEAWGVLQGSLKWWAQGARTWLVDLAQDPGELEDLGSEADDAPWAERLAQALDSPVHRIWRVEGQGERKITRFDQGSVTVSHPDGFEATWATPGIRKQTAQPSLQPDGRALVVGDREARIPTEVLLLPPSPGASPAGLELRVQGGAQRWDARYDPALASDGTLLAAGTGEHAFTITAGWAPRLEQTTPELDAETEQQLRELGYVE